ncbi:MDR family MFS transporter [Dactylosporangium sp. CA-052675]|uniref:MDR family MFS transporter n=1 Tax=Dactylosporangium sp. CA-052675 TaxID=3239927 RepID=UPI003D8AD947
MPTDTPRTAEPLPARRRALGTASALLALALASLDQAIGAILPRVAAELHGLQLYAWVGTAYLMSCAVAVPIAGKLGDLLGRKPFLIAGIVGFMASSGLCGAAPGMGWLVAARALQGVFAGMLIATVYTVLGDLYRPSERARIQGLASSVFGVSSVLGPLAGGFVTDQFGWRWVFYINVPLGLIALAFALSLPRVTGHTTWRDLDLLGSALLAAGLTPLLIGLSLAGTAPGHPSATAWVLMLGGAAVLVGFYLVETRVVAQPLVPFGLFRSNPFTVAIVIAFLSTFGMMAAVYFAPLLFQGVLGQSPTRSGTLLAPLMLGLIVTSTLTGRLLSRVPRYRYLATAALAGLAAALAILAYTRPGAGGGPATLAMVLVGLGMGVLLPLTTSVVQNAVKRSHLGAGTSQIQFWRVMSGPVSVAVLGAVLSAGLAGKVSERLAGVGLPPGVALPGGLADGDPHSALDPAALARMRDTLPPDRPGLYDAIVGAVRLGVADALHTVFLVAAVIAVAAAVASLFLREVPQSDPAPGPTDQAAGRPAAAARDGA